MDFLLWTARSMHLFAVVVWFGGILYQAAVTFPVARVEGKEFDPFTLHLLRRFQPFSWMCVWTLLVTGVALMLFDPRFIFLKFESSWSVLLALKQFVFALMLFFTFGHARMLDGLNREMQHNTANPAQSRYYKQMVSFGRINVGLAIIALLLAAGMK